MPSHIIQEAAQILALRTGMYARDILICYAKGNALIVAELDRLMGDQE